MFNILKKNRQQIKYYLIITNITLAIALVTLLIFGLFVIRPSQIDKAYRLNQYISLNVNATSEVIDSIEPDYTQPKNSSPNLSNNIEIDKPQSNQAALLPASSGQANKAKIAIIITNLGLNRRLTEASLTLPSPIALGFLPYTMNLKPLLNKAQEKGHEIYLYIPFETGRASANPGKYALMTTIGSEENASRLSTILSSQTNYNGVYSSYQERFTADQQAILPILDQIKSKNLIFVLGKDQNFVIPEYLDKRSNLIVTNIVIDHEPDEDLIRKNLNRLVQYAKEHRVAIGYAQGYALTVDIIKNWLPLLEAQSIELVPISNLLQ
jgi:polysaccharide deacetylase 2 family uncharacterized protein YibQ